MVDRNFPPEQSQWTGLGPNFEREFERSEMPPATSPSPNSTVETEIFREGARAAHRIVRLNADGISHEESLGQPQNAGNCLNWVLGHLSFAFMMTSCHRLGSNR